MGYLQQAAYCFRKVLYIDPFDVDALWDRSYLLKLSGDYRRVRIDLAFRCYRDGDACTRQSKVSSRY